MNRLLVFALAVGFGATPAWSQGPIQFVTAPDHASAIANGQPGVPSYSLTSLSFNTGVQTGSGGVFGSALISGTIDRDPASPIPGSLKVTVSSRASVGSPAGATVPSTANVDIAGNGIQIGIVDPMQVVVYRNEGFTGGNPPGSWAACPLGFHFTSGQVIPSGFLSIDATATAYLSQPVGAPAITANGGADLEISLRPTIWCYANCDSSTVPPVLNVNDFICFLNTFQVALSLPPQQQVTSYANCDHSNVAPVLNVNDFICFISAFSQGCPPPAAPSNLRSDPPMPVSVRLFWDDNSDNERFFYIFESADGSNFEFRQGVGANGTTAPVTDLIPDHQYWFRVAAFNEFGGLSAYSNTLSIVTPALPSVPQAPTQLHVLGIGANDIELGWTDNSNNEDNFRIAKSTDGVQFDNAGQTVANATSFDVTELTPNTRYWFKVRASNSVGYSDYTNTIGVTTSVLPPPQAPTNLMFSNLASRSVDLDWTDRSNNEDGFRVARSTDGNQYDNVGVTNPNDTHFHADHLVPNTTYWFKVRAYNTAGFSDYTNTVVLTTPQELPAAPSGLIAANVWARTIDLNWQDNSDNEDGFRVAQSGDGVQYTNVDVTPPNQPHSRVFNLIPNHTYWFKVRAYNSVGYSDYTNIIQVSTPQEPPAAPTGLTVVNLYRTAADVRWTDNSDNEDHFRIALSSNGSDFNNVGETNPNDTSFRIQNLQPNTRYWAKVRASNTAGFSDYTNTITFVTRP